MSNLTDKQIGYIAGIIDGEGTICIAKCTWADRKESYFRPMIKIANTNLEMLTSIKDMLGCGSINLEQVKTDKWKACHTLRFSANMIRTFLPVIVDSLIIKKRQALLVIDFLKFSNRSNGRNFKSLNRDLYNHYYEEVKRLNTRGVVEKTSEFGGTPVKDNTEPSKDRNILGVCNEQGDVAKAMMCSELTGNSKTMAEMTTDR